VFRKMVVCTWFTLQTSHPCPGSRLTIHVLSSRTSLLVPYSHSMGLCKWELAVRPRSFCHSCPVMGSLQSTKYQIPRWARGGLTFSRLVLPSFGGQQGSSGSIYLGIYEGGQQNTTLRMLGLVQSDGVGTILTPRKVFAGSYAIMAGFLGFENASATPSPSVSVVADLTGFSNFYGRGTFTLGLRETFGAQGTIAPSATAKTTQIRLEFPTNSTVVAWGPSTATVNSTQGLYQLLLNTTSSPTPNAFVTFDASFPQRIQIDRRTDPSSTVSAGATVTEKVSVRNLGNETIHGVVVSEKKLFQTYPTLELLSPSYNSTLGDIDPQASREATVQFRVGSNGVYTMPSAEVSYVDQNKTISRESSQTMLVSTFNLELYLGKLVSGTAPYSYPLVGLVVLTPVKSLIGGIGKLSTRRRKKTH